MGASLQTENAPPPSTAVLHKFVGAWTCWSSPTSFHSWSTPPSLLWQLCTLLVQGGRRPALHPVLLLLPWPPLFSLQCPHGLRMFFDALLCCFWRHICHMFRTLLYWDLPLSLSPMHLFPWFFQLLSEAKVALHLLQCKCLPLLFMHSHLVDSESAL